MHYVNCLYSFVAIIDPFTVPKADHKTRTRLMLVWLPLPFFINLIQFVYLQPTNNDGRQCEPRTDGVWQLVMETGDVLMCYLLPCSVVVVLNLLLAGTIVVTNL